ncbi:putative Hydroxysteroid dehydrogenase-like protein 2 [Ascodesmis nigricans]|uniref:Putative Hydroxysteroid dehydrogenase-like protein 2 n=1 Tax=Ascodesmis nigricans TaxID=341454 RepID=A0A4V3SJM6_9PEZI|nr:putative Hydroxysteroid dehydrogenase-like protein 2 [Ascodesmis nigricans]
MATQCPDKVTLVIGGSRGIGRQVAIDFAKAGYAVVVSGRSANDASTVAPFPPNPNSQQSTITTVTREIQELGGIAAAIPVDTRDEKSVTKLIQDTVATFGRIDVLIYNSGAIWWSSVAGTPYKRYKLLQAVNADGLYASIQASLPVFEKQGSKGRIIVVSPPIYSRFFRGKTAYSMAKVSMSVLVKGLAMDWEREGKKDMAITSIWPASSIDSAATTNFKETNPDGARQLRKPTIYSDAMLAIVRAPAEKVNGLLTLDEDFLREFEGVTDFSKYALVPGSTPPRTMPLEFPNLRVKEHDDEGNRIDSNLIRRSKL